MPPSNCHRRGKGGYRLPPPSSFPGGDNLLLWGMKEGIEYELGVEAVDMEDPHLFHYSRLARLTGTCTHTPTRTVLFCSLAVLDPRVGHTMDVLS